MSRLTCFGKELEEMTEREALLAAAMTLASVQVSLCAGTMNRDLASAFAEDIREIREHLAKTAAANA